MGESKRPRQITVYKSGSDGGFDQLVPWLYVVSELSECRSEFAVAVKLVADAVDAVLCQLYATPAAAEMNEHVIDYRLCRHSHNTVPLRLAPRRKVF